jgi:hypothetical protein
MDNDLEVRFKALEDRVKDLEEKLIGGVVLRNAIGKPNESMSINEFLNTKVLGDDVKRTLAIAYWLDYFEKLESFNASDVQNAFRVARLKPLSNVNDKINMNVRNGHLAEEKKKKDGKKSWYVTNSGAQYVEEDLKK